MASVHYRLIAADGTELEAGAGDVALAGGVLELQPADGAALRVQAAAIASVAEPEPYTVLVTLADGTALELARLGRMRTQLLEELRDARAEVAAERSGAVGDSARFTATIAGSPVDLHVFEDALLVITGGSARRIAFSFVNDVRAQDHAVTIDAAGQDTITVTRLGRRTDEFTALLIERLRAARTRTSAFFSSLLPGLDPMALRAAAGLLRDGVAAPARALDAIHPGLSAAMLRVAALPDRWTAVSALADRTDLAIGFRQLASVRRPAVGLTPWRDPSATPHIGQHESPGGRFGSGLGGVITAGLASNLGPGGYGPGGYGPGGYGGGGGYGGPFGGGPRAYGELGAYWAFRALGAGLNGNSGGRPVTPAADVQLAPLIPATDDLTALTVSGAEPTVLAFALLSPAGGGDPVAYEVLNLPEPQTYVYRAGGADPRARVNQALDDVGFAAAEISAAATGDLTAARRQDAIDGPGSPLVRGLVATLPHTPDWAREVAARLDDR